MPEEKRMMTQALVLMVTAIIALGTGMLVFQHTTNNLSWTSMDNPASYNMTTDTIENTYSMLPTFAGIAVVIIVIMIVVTYLHYPAQKIEESKVLKFLILSMYYFAFGLLGLVCFAPPFLMGYFLFDYVIVQGHSGSFTWLIQALALMILAYFSIAGFGYFFKKILYDRIKARWEEHRLIGEIDDEDNEETESENRTTI